MVAAVISATSVAKIDSPVSQISGSNRKMKTLYLEGVKATQADWLLLSSYLSAAELDQVTSIHIEEKASDDTHAVGTYTYDSGDAKLVLASAKLGTAYVHIKYYEA